MKVNMRPKGFIITPLIMGLIAGMIVAGSVAAYYAYRTQVLKARATLITTPVTNSESNSEEVGIKFSKEGDEISRINFENLRGGEEEIQIVTIKNTSRHKDIKVLVLGDSSSEGKNREYEPQIWDYSLSQIFLPEFELDSVIG